MTWTFNSSSVGSSGLATVRFYTGDTSSGTQLMTDEVINAVLTNIATDYTHAAIYCLESLAAQYSFQADTRNEGLDIMGSQRAKAYAQRAADLRRRVGLGAELFVGGRSQDTKDDYADDSDLVQPAFEREMDDFPGTISSSTSV